MKHEVKKAPKNAQRIWRVSDLPKNRAPARYAITHENGKTETYVLDKRRRQVIDLLAQGPVYCASPVRLSDIVFLLKRETGLDVHTEFFPGDPDTGAGTYGVYFLHSVVERIDNMGAAA